MKDLFKRHYNAIVKRGLITPETTKQDFWNKAEEELLELQVEIFQEDNWKQESIDLICATMNMLIHNGVDIEYELCKNIEKQEERAKNNNT